MILCNGIRKIAELELDVHIGYAVFNVARILDFDGLPLSWKYYFSLPKNERPESFFDNWLLQRVLPRRRENLDQLVQRELHLHYSGYGRMNEHVYLLSLLNYFRSPLDPFRISPKNIQALYFGFEDPHMEYVYELMPEGTDFLSGIQEVCICSECPTWVVDKDDNVFLCQNIARIRKNAPELLSRVEKETEKWRFQYVPKDNIGQISIGTVFREGEVSWLQEYVPFLDSDDAEHIYERYIRIFEKILPKTNIANTVSELFQLFDKTSQLERCISFSECGVAYTKGQVHPFLIL